MARKLVNDCPCGAAARMSKTKSGYRVVTTRNCWGGKPNRRFKYREDAMADWAHKCKIARKAFPESRASAALKKGKKHGK